MKYINIAFVAFGFFMAGTHAVDADLGWMFAWIGSGALNAIAVMARCKK